MSDVGDSFIPCEADLANSQFSSVWLNSGVEIQISNAVPISNERFKIGVPVVTPLGCIGNANDIYVSFRFSILYSQQPYRYNLYDGNFFKLRIKDSPRGEIIEEFGIFSEAPIHWPAYHWLDVACQYPSIYSYASSRSDRESDLLRPNRNSKNLSRATVLRKV